MKCYYFIFLLLLIFLQCDNLSFEVKAPVIKSDENNGEYKISMKSGTYGVIFYSTDGSLPTRDSKRYSSSFTVKGGTTVRAVSICPSGRKSKISEVTINNPQILNINPLGFCK